MVTEQWRLCLLALDSTVQEAVQALDTAGLQIVIVVGPGDLLAGTITDGDIRRGLLRGLQLSDSIAQIVNRDPLVVPPSLADEMVLQLMQANKIHQLPVVDSDRRVVGLHVWDDLHQPSLRANAMVIMAGGKGTRLRPFTKDCPKPLLPVGGKPMLEHIILRAQSDGFRHFVLAIHYLGHMIEEYFGDGSRWNVHISYLREEAPLGTGGALSLLDPVPTSPFVVTNGDVLTDVRYGDIVEYHDRHEAAATMAVRAYEWQNPFGVVRTQGVEIAGFEEKPVFRTHVNAGIYVIDPRALTALRPGDHCDMPTLFDRLRASSERTIVYPMHEPWLDVGRPADLAEARSAHSS